VIDWVIKLSIAINDVIYFDDNCLKNIFRNNQFWFAIEKN
jgi:hypothetical protein